MDVLISMLTQNAGPAAVNPLTAATGVSTSALPAIFAQLAPGTLVRGFVLNRDAKGNPVLRTDLGDVLIQSSYFLKIGSDVVLRVDPRGQRGHASIVTVDGQPPEEAESTPAHAGDDDVVVPPSRNAKPQQATTANEAARPERPAPPPQPQGVLRGTLTALPPPPAEGEAVPLPRAATPPSFLTFRLVQVMQNPTATPQALTPPSPGGRGSLPPAAPPQQLEENVARTPASPLSAYTRFAAKPVPATALPEFNTPRVTNTVTTIAPSPTQTPSTPAPTLLTGVVVRQDANGEPIVETPRGMLRFHSALPLPPGSTVQLEVLQQMADRRTGVFPAPLPELAAGWDTLDDILRQLRTIDPEAADAMLSMLSTGLTAGAGQNTPKAPLTPQGMDSAMFFFLSALSGGDVKALFGARVSKLLEDPKLAPLLAKAQAELGTMREAFQNVPPGQWQPLFLPVPVEGEWRQLRMYIKRDREKKERPTPKSPADTRFIVEFDLTALGPLQLDGMVRKDGNVETQFNLIVRSHVGLGNAVEDGVRAIYSSIGEVTGYKGAVIFQAVNDFPVKPLEEILSQPMGPVVV